MKKLWKSVQPEVFKKVWLYGTLSFVAFLLLTQFFGAFFQEALVSFLPSLQAAVTSPSKILVVLLLTILTIVLFFASLVYSYSFFENLIWNTILHKKTTFKNTSQFLLLNILLFILVSLIILLAYVLYTLLYSKGWPKLGFTILSFVVLYTIYTLMVGYISFAHTQKVLRSVKNAFVIGIKKLDITIFPFVIAIAMGAVLNLILLLFKGLPLNINLFVSGVVFAAYMAWFRIYFANTLESVKF